jgi:hypothetical protein
MDNVHTWHIIDSFELIIDFCVVDQERKSLWTTSVNNYRTVMVLLWNKKEDFLNEDIALYQRHADYFFQAWVILWKKRE